ncbi:Plastin-2 [Clonorchis sinensis]|uniref:Plastin-2 n=1 Tax=Clonorchis sinensis TaxID=79923 RepID=A0A8T1M4C5_CLOSI|nr:Plastin-2 [Clonorchis sinensis]
MLTHVYEWDVLLKATSKIELEVNSNKLRCIESLSEHLNYTIHIAWEQFKHQFDRVYSDAEESSKRLNVFCENFLYVRRHNNAYEEGTESFKLGINQFADRTREETQHACGGEAVFPNSRESVSAYRKISAVPPKSIDWRMYGAVTPIRAQGSCGSCWAFSAAAAMESHHFLHYRWLYTLSPQQLIDCSLMYGNHGCNGGNAQLAFMYVQHGGGIECEVDYPYVSDRTLRPNPYCRLEAHKVAVRVSGAVALPLYDEDALTQAVGLLGPVAIMVNSSPQDFVKYEYDIYDDPACGTTLREVDHAMLLVGYGEEGGIPYWLIKNSWGDHWGENGYMRMRRGVNRCAVASYAVYPLLP